MKKKTTAVGALVMTGLLLVSLPLGVNRSLGKLREDAKLQYYGDQTGYAIYQGVDEREAAAKNMITVARRYTDQNPALTEAVDELEYQVKVSENTYDDFSAEAEANRKMGEAAQALYEQLEQTELSEKDAKYPRELIAQMDAEQDKIDRSSYNDAAREFNARLEKFPVDLLRHVAFVEPLDLFEASP